MPHDGKYPADGHQSACLPSLRGQGPRCCRFLSAFDWPQSSIERPGKLLLPCFEEPRTTEDMRARRGRASNHRSRHGNAGLADELSTVQQAADQPPATRSRMVVGSSAACRLKRPALACTIGAVYRATYAALQALRLSCDIHLLNEGWSPPPSSSAVSTTADMFALHQSRSEFVNNPTVVFVAVVVGVGWEESVVQL